MSPDFKKPQDMWDARYGTPEFVYGEGPNLFFKQQIDALPPGRLLLPAEGEGRNALYAASRRWMVHAMDFSAVGRQKALDRAQALGLRLQYDVADLESAALGVGAYDAIGLIFVHLPPAVRVPFHRRVAAALAPGGRIILQAYHPRQLSRGTGGPGQVDLLVTLDMLKQEFSGLQWEVESESVETLQEGTLHRGPSEVVSAVLRKP